MTRKTCRCVARAGLVVLFSITSPWLAQAQTGTAKSSEGWDFTVAPYLLLPWMNGQAAVVGQPVSVDVGPSDILRNLQIGGMGSFEARNGPWAAAVDAVYMALGTTVDRVPVLGDRASADVDFNQGAYTFTGMRQIHRKVDALAGVRWSVLQARIGLKGPNQTVFKETRQWVDPIIGLKLKQSLGERWHFTLESDIGGFGAGSDFAWQVFPVLGADIGKRATLGLGYRVLSMDYTTGSAPRVFKYDVVTQGIVLGVAFHL